MYSILSIVVHNDWYTVVLHEWFLGIITDCMQFVDRIELEWFLFLNNVYWMNMGWMCEDCIPWRWTVLYWKKRKEEKRTFSALDSNPFNDVYSIFMPSMIMIMRIEWERIKMGWDWDWLWFGVNSISVFITENGWAMHKYDLEVGVDCSLASIVT